MKCAYMNRECTPDCVAYVPTNGPDNRQFYHFVFQCARVDAAYDLAGAMVKIYETLEERMG